MISCSFKLQLCYPPTFTFQETARQVSVIYSLRRSRERNQIIVKPVAAHRLRSEFLSVERTPMVTSTLPCLAILCLVCVLSPSKAEQRKNGCSVPYLRWLIAVPTAATWIRFYVRYCGVCIAQIITVRDCLLVFRFSLPMLIPPTLYIRLSSGLA